MQIIGHGIDVVAIGRIARMLDDHGDRFIERCFTGGERNYAESGQKRRVERYAVRFACKEAVLKALGTGWRSGISWTDIDVRRAPSGHPTVVLTGRCAAIAVEQQIDQWLVSLSHTEEVAVASAIACGR